MSERCGVKLLFLIALFLVSIFPLLGRDLVDKDWSGFARLLQKAQEQGWVRVIVRLDVPGLDALQGCSRNYRGKVSGLEARGANPDRLLSEAIASRRNAVLAGLKGVWYVVGRTFDTVPYVALSVAPDALRILPDIPGVLDVIEDRPNALEPDTGGDSFFSRVEGVGPSAQERSRTERVPGAEPEAQPRTVELNPAERLIGAYEAWQQGFSGAGWHVAVLDTGIRRTHEMFAGKDVVEACFAQGADPSQHPDVGDCPGGLREQTGPGSASHYADEFYHGSHVAGIAVGNNGFNRFGVARDAGLIAVNVYSWFPDYQDVMSWTSDQMKGMEYVYSLRHGYRIASVNMSLGSSASYSAACDDDPRNSLLENLRAAGIATVISSGNDARCGSVCAPACISGAVAVGGSTLEDGTYFWGNWDDLLVGLVAPGEYINSASAMWDAGYTTMSGTSAAAPHVAGAWAVLRQCDPDLTVVMGLSCLRQSGRPLTNERCPDEGALPRIQLAARVAGDAPGAVELLQSRQPADLNLDGRTDAMDRAILTDYFTGKALFLLCGNWADLNDDGFVNVQDLVLLDLALAVP